MPRRRRRRRCSSPAACPLALEDNDILEDILLRLPPQPSSLTRAASVCDRWRRLVTSPDFLRRLRSIHREPPLLGVFMNYGGYPLFHSVLDPPDAIPPERFLLWRDEDDNWDLFGVRHGRVLIYNYPRHEFIVWDPATGDRRCVAIPEKLRDKEMRVCNGAVLCAAGGQGHVHGRDCHWSPFQVILIGISDERRAVACLYSSATGEWGDLSSANIRYSDYTVSSSTLIGDSLYWLLEEIEGGILEFDLGRQILEVIESPRDVAGVRSDDIHIISAEDGGVGLAVTTPVSLDMWDRKISSDGICTWVLWKTVKLEEITGLSRDERGHVVIHGYDEDDDAIFLMTDMGCFVVQLQSMQFRNLGVRDFKINYFHQTCAYHPYRSFYSCKGFTLDYQMAWDDCIRAFKEKKLILQEVLNSANCRISFTTDMLTLNETTGYMCVTCHFIDNDWKVQKRVIKFFVVQTSYDGVDLFNAVLKCIQDWNIEEKIFGITLVNSAANYTMVEMLKCNLVDKKVLPAGGKFLHTRCAAHVINLIVNDGLKLIDPIVGKIRESVKYIKSSQSRMRKFEEIIAQENISCKGWLSLDIPTNWYSTYWLLEKALEFKRVFNSFALQDANYTYAPSFEEWERVRVVCRVLKACYEATEAISCSSCRTSNLYFHSIWLIKLALDGETSDVDNDVRKVIKGMKKKFNKYWMKSYISLSIPVVLDPRFKFMFIKFRFEQSYGADAGKWLKRVRKVLRGLFDEYSSQSGDCDVDSTEDGSDQEIDMEEDGPFADWYEHLSKNSRVTTELDRYLNESPVRQSEGFDILKWWMVYSPMYPNLARIARDMLAMPMSTVASKSAFSTKGRTISDYHIRLTPETTEALICLQDWSRPSDYHPCLWSITFGDRDEFPIDSLCLY